MNYFKDGLSINETRVSALVVAFLITLGFGLWQVIDIGEMSNNIVTVLGYEITGIVGVNVAERFTSNKNYEDVSG